MIVNSTPAGWQIIYQQAHALLAAQLAYAWAPTLPPDRWVGLLAAIAQHDDEQAAWRGRGGHHGLTAAGAPANFTQKEFSMEQAAGVLAAARFQGRWRSLLTSLHLSCLYEGLRGQKKEIDAFLDELHTQQRQWERALHITKKEAGQAYALLHWCDRLSLILCRHEIPEMGRAVEISPRARWNDAHAGPARGRRPGSYQPLAVSGQGNRSKRGGQRAHPASVSRRCRAGRSPARRPGRNAALDATRVVASKGFEWRASNSKVEL